MRWRLRRFELMQTSTRRHRSSNVPIGRERTITPHEIDERYIEVLRLLEPYHHFKYLTIPWLHYLSNIRVEYSVFRKDSSVVAPAIDPNPDRRVCLLWFLREDPHECWPSTFVKHAQEIDASGKGRLVLLAPFVPTLPGTVTTLA